METNEELEKLTDKISYDLNINGIESFKIKTGINTPEISPLPKVKTC